MFADSSPTFDTKSAAWLDERRVPGDVRKKLGSVAALLSASNPAELPLSLVQLQTPSGIPTSPATASHVVVSTALHANLLRTADELRSEIEGVTRFKEAAQRNIGIFHSASMRFLPPNQGAVRVYSPGQRDFAPADVSSDGSVSIEGPFAYVLATTTVDRLEPDPPFLISPLVKRIPLRAGEMDVIVVRPTRDPVVLDAIQPGQIPIYGSGWDELDSSAEQRATGVWPARAMSCIGKAYGKGEHVDLVYSSAESADQDAGQHVVAEQGDEREAVVEVFRCGGWEWTPSVSRRCRARDKASGYVTGLTVAERRRGTSPYGLHRWSDPDYPRWRLGHGVFGRRRRGRSPFHGLYLNSVALHRGTAAPTVGQS